MKPSEKDKKTKEWKLYPGSTSTSIPFSSISSSSLVYRGPPLLQQLQHPPGTTTSTTTPSQQQKPVRIVWPPRASSMLPEVSGAAQQPLQQLQQQGKALLQRANAVIKTAGEKIEKYAAEQGVDLGGYVGGAGGSGSVASPTAAVGTGVAAGVGPPTPPGISRHKNKRILVRTQTIERKITLAPPLPPRPQQSPSTFELVLAPLPASAGPVGSSFYAVLRNNNKRVEFLPTAAAAASNSAGVSASGGGGAIAAARSVVSSNPLEELINLKAGGFFTYFEVTVNFMHQSTTYSSPSASTPAQQNPPSPTTPTSTGSTPVSSAARAFSFTSSSSSLLSSPTEGGIIKPPSVPTTTISVGVVGKGYRSNRLPGWDECSVAYSSRGVCYQGSRFGKPFGEVCVEGMGAATGAGSVGGDGDGGVSEEKPSESKAKKQSQGYKTGDVIGVGYIPLLGSVFFTRNGEFLGQAVGGLKGGEADKNQQGEGAQQQLFYAGVGADGPCILTLNFGTEPFKWAVANGTTIEAKVTTTIKTTTTASPETVDPEGERDGGGILDAFDIVLSDKES
ncbi:Rsp5p-dependent ubiquitination, sorting of cargo proteins at the multivesicular body, partial [Quaeritorhiza haematococci]